MTTDDNKEAPRRKPALADIAPDDWFDDRDESSAWIRVYTSLHVPHQEYLASVDGAAVRLGRDADVPIAIAYAIMADLEVPSSRSWIHSMETGITAVKVEVDKFTLERSTYVIFAAPFRRPERTISEPTARKAIGRAASVFAAHLGQSFLWSKVFEGELELKDGKLHVPGRAIRLPQPVDGPFANVSNWNDIKEIDVQLARMAPELRSRIELALEFFERAIWEEDSFFFYWTALEVLCSGKAQTIRHRLGECYGTSDYSRLDVESGFGTIARWRHDLFHKGRRTTLSADVGRYMQLLFLDLLRHIIGLSPRHYVAQVQGATGYDLRPLGLTDNRTAEQKAAADGT